ncbi:MAG: hypothetical protein IAE80_26970 [Anaerolinea sp.]|nr:hypothetical protein [Anaerolinea sp.]
METQRPVIEFYPLDEGLNIPAFVQPSDRLRASFETPMYQCLPMVTANTLGWTVYNRFDFSVVWRGGAETADVVVETDHPEWVASWFGFGTFTIFPRFIVRTPPGVNLLVRPVPNIYKHNVQTFEGFIETDWMNNTFTLNFRMQMPVIRVTYKAGDPLAQLVPYGRHFVEGFDAEVVTSGDGYAKTMQEFALWREKRVDRVTTHAGYSLDYMRGEDIHGNKFEDHVKVLKVAPIKVRE